MEEMMMPAGNQNPNAANQNQNNQPPAPPSGPEGVQRAPAAAPAAAAAAGGAERKARPQKEKAINCPRCNSTNTKFCYYNNYSLQQPRYFCKTCRRYWTEGGSLRNVPVGGGSRKNKRSSSSSSAAAAAVSTSAAAGTVPAANKNPKLMLQHEAGGGAHDLNLAFPHHHGRVLHPSEFAASFPSLESSAVMAAANGGGRGGMHQGAFSAMELLRSTGCYVPLPQGMQLGAMPPEYGFALGPEFRMPAPPHQQQQQHHQQQQQVQNMLGFSLDTGAGGGYGAGLQGAQESAASGRMLFPFEDLKPGVVSAAAGGATGGDQFEHSKADQGQGQGGNNSGGHETLGFWNNSMIGNGGSNDAGGGGGGGSW
ncbi:dof zinc finger protein 2 isoform X2 [Brachypodium distachyon]|nr:dof zinc finger protein 2 isoform X2 [Brachypodium distachyon]KQK00737.1 hypothetical protein BRADI_3g51510v3 [Brachypodium distachyon]|eukprot:XP_014756973.1 dof zinc finger protein 2 isoform X2 [Brachypodium distachyon]